LPHFRCGVEKDHLSVRDAASVRISDIPLNASRELRKRCRGRKQDVDGSCYDPAKFEMGACSGRDSAWHDHGFPFKVLTWQD
jgi:hypothetical protein